MRGFPKKLNSKFDYLYIKDKFPANQWKPAWKELISESKNWFFTEKLENEADGLTDDTHKVEKGKNVDGNVVFYQYELRTDPSSDMVRMGFTEKEINDVLNNA